MALLRAMKSSKDSELNRVVSSDLSAPPAPSILIPLAISLLPLSGFKRVAFPKSATGVRAGSMLACFSKLKQ